MHIHIWKDTPKKEYTLRYMTSLDEKRVKDLAKILINKLFDGKIPN